MAFKMQIYRIIKKYYIKISEYYSNNNLILQIVAKNFFFNVIYYMAGKNLKKESTKCNNLQEFVALALNYKYSIFKFLPTIIFLGSQQKEKEILGFSRLIHKIKPKKILEIGTARGGTFFLFSRICSKKSTLFSIDLPIMTYASGVTLPPPPKNFFKAFKLDNQKIVIIRSDSQNSSTINKVKKKLKEEKLDVLFIDGNHSYEGVKNDFKLYAPLVRKGGIIAFHDIVDVPSYVDVQVNKFWNEIKQSYQHIEFVEDWNQGRFGIGVIYNK